MEDITIGFKLFRVKPNGALGPLFINRSQDIPMNEWLEAEAHQTKGFAFRPGWHAALKPEAPHLKIELSNGETRVWARVALSGTRLYDRPESQGGTWVLAERLMVLEVL
jgi:hypothetical protein